MHQKSMDRNECLCLFMFVYLCSNHFKEACFNKSWVLQVQLFYMYFTCISLGSWGWCEPPSRSRAAPWWGFEFLKKVVNIGIQKIFEKLKIDTF